MISCHHSNNVPEEDGSTLLNKPTDKVTVIVEDKTFTVDFRIDEEGCMWWVNDLFPKGIEQIEQLKTRDDLIDLFKSISPYYFMPNYHGDIVQQSYAFKVDYMLAQECFSDGCASEIRKDILQLTVTNQKAYIRNLHPYCARKSGVFLMAVILLKERNISEKYIDDVILQQALLCLNTDTWGVDDEFNNLIIEGSKKFLDDGTTHEEEEESTLLHEPTDEVTVTVGDKIFTVDFRFDADCKQNMQLQFDGILVASRFANVKTRDDLINFYKFRQPSFLPSFSSEFDYNEVIFVKAEYLLSQECFSDLCESATRKEVLQLAIDKQKAKINREFYINPYCVQKSGIFLMAIILLKERSASVNFIDDETLQKALLYLRSDTRVKEDLSDLYDTEDFSNFIIECSGKFLNESKM